MSGRSITVDAVPMPGATDEHDGYAKGEYVKIAERPGQVFKVMGFVVLDGRPAEVSVYGGVRSKEEWTSAQFHTFVASRIVRRCKTVIGPQGGVIVR